jgi:LacI family transcriptional regulator
MAHLLGLGHRRIAHLTESEEVTDPASGTPHALRLRTYEECMVGAGHGELVRVARGGSTERTAYDATVALLHEADRPTAIFAAHDQLAIGVLAAVADLGLGPQDVSVVGYDNTEIAAHPAISLTSVDQSGAEMGRQAAAMLLERIQGRAEPRHHTLTPRLCVRRSTAQRPAGIAANGEE